MHLSFLGVIILVAIFSWSEGLECLKKDFLTAEQFTRLWYLTRWSATLSWANMITWSAASSPRHTVKMTLGTTFAFTTRWMNLLPIKTCLTSLNTKSTNICALFNALSEKEKIALIALELVPEPYLEEWWDTTWVRASPYLLTRRFFGEEWLRNFSGSSRGQLMQTS